MPLCLEQSLPLTGGRLTIYEEPHPEKVYCLGFDSASGIAGGDFDAAVLLDQYGEQIATVHGHWGESFDQILRPLCDWYWPFIVGERKSTGLTILRHLYDDAYWLYFDRKDEAKGRPQRDILGHARYHGDSIIPNLQRAIGLLDSAGHPQPSKIIIHDDEVHTQLSHFAYRARSTRDTVETCDDDNLTYSSPKGEHDDLVMATAYAVHGLIWLPRFERPRPKYNPGTLGDLLAHESVFNPPPPPPSRLAARSGRSKP